MSAGSDTLFNYIESRADLTDEQKTAMLSLYVDICGKTPNVWEGCACERAVKILLTKVLKTPAGTSHPERVEGAAVKYKVH